MGSAVDGIDGAVAQAATGGLVTAGDRSRRLCIVVHGPYPIGEPRVARQARAALAGGLHVDVVAMRRDGEPHYEVVDGVAVHRLPIEHRRGAGALGMLREYLGFTLLATIRVARLARRRRYTLVQIANPPDFLVLAGAIPKLFGARLVLDVHDLAPDLFASRFEGRRGSRFVDAVLRMFERIAVRAVDSIVTVHEPYRQALIERGAPASKVTVVMNSLDETLLPKQASSQDKGDRFRIVYHGTVTTWYGVELVVDALAAILADVPQAHLEIYGEGDALPAVRARAAAHGISDHVTASGTYLPQAEVLALVLGADVGVIPNLPTRLNRYALSSKLFEYVALDIPVVSADLPTLRAHFDDHEVRFFHAGDATSLAAALGELAKDPDAASVRARAARSRYEAYRWHRNAATYLGVLDAAGALGLQHA